MSADCDASDESEQALYLHKAKSMNNAGYAPAVFMKYN